MTTETINRRTALALLSGMFGAGLATGCEHRGSTDDPTSRKKISTMITKFTWKRQYPNLEIISPTYRFVWQARWLGFRLCGTKAHPYSEEITFNTFGAFQTGSVDLVCNHRYIITPVLADGTPLDEVEKDGQHFGENFFLFPVLDNDLYVSLEDDPRGPVFRMDHMDKSGRWLKLYFCFEEGTSDIHLTIKPEGYELTQPAFIPLNGALVFDEIFQEGSTAAYYSSGASTGLKVTGETPDSLTLNKMENRVSVMCRVPLDRPSVWTLTVLGPGDWPPSESHIAVKGGDVLSKSYKKVTLTDLKSWESEKMVERSWEPQREGVKERVAGVYITSERWAHSLSWLPEAKIDYVRDRFLDLLIEADAFDAVGLSRDGIYESGEDRLWHDLVEKVHRAGLRVYLKPGDGEMTRLHGREEIDRWAKTVFDVPEERLCDVFRFTNESVNVPWTSANLCLHPRFYTERLDNLDHCSWPEAREAIVNTVADRFSLVIDAIRRFVPDMTIDIESCDTDVIEVLMKRHGNLGVMYMAYGDFPAISDFMDMYNCVARYQLGAERIVHEADCYYTKRYPSLLSLRGTPYEEMYPDEDIERMAQKHKHMNSLKADAAWAWGINITFTEKKFLAICDAVSA